MAKDPQRDAERRREILDAALACFLQFGYAKTSLDDIAQRAGISRPLLYRKYKNKEDIFGACYDDVFDQLYPRCQAILDSRASRKDKLKLTRGSVMVGCPLCNLDLPDKMPGATPTAAPRTAAPQQQQQQQ